MPEVKEITVLTIDDVPHEVESMTDVCQRLVAVFNEWNQKEANARDELMILQAAKETLSRQIIEQVRKEKAELEAAEKKAAEKEANAEQPSETVNTTKAPAEEVAQEAPGDE